MFPTQNISNRQICKQQQLRIVAELMQGQDVLDVKVGLLVLLPLCSVRVDPPTSLWPAAEPAEPAEPCRLEVRH